MSYISMSMLIKDSISDYRYLNFGGIKLAYTMVCKDDTFRDVYFSANTLYFVETGTAVLQSGNTIVRLKEGEIALIRQHSKLNIQKKKNETENRNFRAVIFYLFPDFISEFLKGKSKSKKSSSTDTANIIALTRKDHSKELSQSLLSLFNTQKMDKALLKEKTFEAVSLLLQRNKDIADFLTMNADSVKIDLYEFMLNNILTEYTLKDFAQLTGRSLSSFKRDFSTVFNTTPHNWILSRKLDYAEELLLRQSMKPVDIYHFLGFKELSHFSSAFKKAKGVSPTRI